ncbi:hypothetical protein LQZ39_09060 [Enterobacter cloacae complex sp. RIVM_C039474]|uniref:hypothetical protein n=1 Tax=Enterobacter cloacae complex sp. RIVM_C039474 TaxID=2900327 RepID=UPI00233F8ADB|nr:hypothetical protein [Enterobacter cloacae complex sp. RIVM_C039474]MDC4194677.1 hypothetical protein [Enterobacter cloacae complex sp. RIVM_C039474]
MSKLHALVAGQGRIWTLTLKRISIALTVIIHHPDTTYWMSGMANRKILVIRVFQQVVPIAGAVKPYVSSEGDICAQTVLFFMIQSVLVTTVEEAVHQSVK